MLDQMPLYVVYKGWTGLCKSVHPWGHVSEIQSIKEGMGGGAVSDQQHNINQSVSQHGL